MARNVEIKARLHDSAFAHATAARLSGQSPKYIEQCDIFFDCARGRLKLRILGDQRGELIHYERPDTEASRVSDYVIVPTEHPAVLRETLQRALNVLGTIEKTRALYLIGQTRVHIDDVRDLGTFLEFEVVLQPGQDESEGRAIAEQLCREFHIDRQDVIGCAYVDLLGRTRRAGGT
jgi:predicted adenylyl cyclase CyaB